MLLVMGHLRVRAADIARLRTPIARQTAAVREFHGCEHYSIAVDILEPDVLQVAERWRTRAAQSAHLIGDHMIEFNIGMRAAQIVAASIDSYDDGKIQRLMQIPATSFRGEQTDTAMVLMMGKARLAGDEFDRIKAEMAALVIGARGEDGCVHYAFSRDILDPQTLHIAARWRDAEALAAHFRTPQMAVFDAALAGAKVEGMTVKAYEGTGERTLVER